MSSNLVGTGLSANPLVWRLYVDESGDEARTHFNLPGRRHLCLLGCLLDNDSYQIFHDQLEVLRREFFPNHRPDDPVILHREDIINRKAGFAVLNDPRRSAAFDQALVALIGGTNFKLIATLIEKEACALYFKEKGFGSPDYYGSAYRSLLLKYAEVLHGSKAVGTVLAEARGRQDSVLKQVHDTILTRGIAKRTGLYFTNVINPAELDFRNKRANISGLQLADLLCHPVKRWVLQQRSAGGVTLGRFAQMLVEVLQPRLSAHEIQSIENYGCVLVPKGIQDGLEGEATSIIRP